MFELLLWLCAIAAVLNVLIHPYVGAGFIFVAGAILLLSPIPPIMIIIAAALVVLIIACIVGPVEAWELAHRVNQRNMDANLRARRNDVAGSRPRTCGQMYSWTPFIVGERLLARGYGP
jgi:hypothetical protein